MTDKIVQMKLDEEEKNDEDGIHQRIEDLEDGFQVGLTWESSNHFNIMFMEDFSVTYIYKDPKDVPDVIKKLIYIQSTPGVDGQVLQRNIQTGNYTIDNLSTFDHKKLFERLKILRTKIVELEDHINDDYVLTTDNFLKMNVIYLRVQSRIPVIIMGETGCGKTSLIRFFCQNIRSEELRIFNIHAGVTT